MRDVDDDEEYEIEQVQNVEVPQMVLPVGMVGVELGDFMAMTAMSQRLTILQERVKAGEPMTKEYLLRALGAFDEANGEALYRKVKKEKTDEKD